MLTNDITAIIPTYNRAKELALTLPSYMENTYVKRIIIVNNGSVDETSEVIKSFNNDRVELTEIKVPCKVGAPKARMIGISEAKTEYILIGEDDVYLLPNYTEVLVSQMHEYSCDIISGKIINIKIGLDCEIDKYISTIKTDDSIGFPQDFKPFHVLPQNFESGLPIPVPYTHIIVLAKKNVFTNVLFDSSYSAGNGYREDTDFLLAARNFGFKLFFSQDTACYHLRGVMSKNGGQRVNRLLVEYWSVYNTLLMLKKHWNILSTDFELRKGPLFNTLLYCKDRWKAYLLRFMRFDF